MASFCAYQLVAGERTRLRFYYPTSYPCLTKTPLPAAGKYVVVQGYVRWVEIKHRVCK